MERHIENIGRMIRLERIRQGLTQEDLGKKVGVGKAQISKIENGSKLTINTIMKVLDSLNLKASIFLWSNPDINKNTDINKDVIGYIVAAISEFAKAHNLSIKEASNYLNRFKGIQFLVDYYDAEHLLSFDDCVEDMTHICLNNGGGIK